MVIEFEEFIRPLGPVAIIGKDGPISDNFRRATSWEISPAFYCVFRDGTFLGDFRMPRDRDFLEEAIPNIRFMEPELALKMYQKKTFNI